MDFVCPTCGSRSFLVLHGEPMEVKCLKCGTVAPFSAAVGLADEIGETEGSLKPTKDDDSPPRVEAMDFVSPPTEQPFSPPAFACPKCGGQSFTVLPGKPVEVACLKCGAVSPFSTAG